jgi:hypothetical protein
MCRACYCYFYCYCYHCHYRVKIFSISELKENAYFIPCWDTCVVSCAHKTLLYWHQFQSTVICTFISTPQAFKPVLLCSVCLDTLQLTNSRNINKCRELLHAESTRLRRVGYRIFEPYDRNNVTKCILYHEYHKLIF